MRLYSRVLICLAVAPGTLCGLLRPAWSSDDAGVSAQTAAVSASGAPDGVLQFDISAQPLHAALSQYADATGQPALFPSELVGGRTSVAVHGRHTAEAALHMLLQGTGLVADKRDSGLGRTFVLKRVANLPPAPRNAMTALFGEAGYPGLMQARIWQALCANALTRPGSYSSLLRFHLEANGGIGGARVVEGSGDARRDAALLDTLRTVHIDRPPPAAIVQQPVTMLIGSGVSAATARCGSAQGAG